MFWYNWYGYYDFAKSIGVEFDKKKFKEMRDIILNIPLIITLGEILIVVEKPLCRWNEGNLHSDEFPAIQWKDETGIYFLNAVRFEKDLWQKVVSKKITFKEILKIEDIDQRTQAMRYADVNKFLKHAKAELLDDYNKISINGDNVNYKLYKIPKGEIFTEDAYYAVYDDPSTMKKYMSGVEPCKTVSKAMSWKHFMTEEQWKRLVPLHHES